MDVHRLYVDSKGRVNGDPSEFEYQLRLNVTVAQESITVLDTGLIPVSWYVVEEVSTIGYMSLSKTLFDLAIASPQSLLAIMTMCSPWRQAFKKH